ncbi:MAG: sugar transferase [Acidobacteria bacterium]|nr:MAG: sugar transferase [Acidobacteriota bacterium]
MLKERGRALATSIFVLDLLLVGAAFFLAYWLRASLLPALLPAAFPIPFYPLKTYLPLLPLVLAIWAPLLLLSGQYRSHRTIPIDREIRAIVKVCLWGVGILTLSVYGLRIDALLLGDDELSRLWLVLVGACAGVLLLLEKITLRTLSRWVRLQGYNYRTMLIVGTHEGAISLADSIQDHRYWGYRILGLIAHPGADVSRVPPRYKVLGTIDDIPRIVESTVVDDVLFCVGRRDLNRLEDLFLALQEQGIRTRFALNLFPHTKAKSRLEELDGTPLLTFSTTPESWLALLAKRLIDVTVSTVLLVLGLPVVLLIALAIKLTSRGQVLYRQTRCGLNGRRFTLYKFRTMIEGAEARKGDLLHLNEMDGPVFKLRDDPRVTRLGRILRRFSLDELPQLWNVLRGDMSLVGPRPPIPDEVAQYQRWQRRRLSMKPGLTCLWQISGRNQLDFDRWMELDLEYIDSWSPWLDLKILFKTVPAVLSGRGAS